MEGNDFSRAAKARSLNDFFHAQGRIYIVVDATREDVILPEHLKGELSLHLVLNTKMPQIIEIKAKGVRSRFSFGGVSSDCIIAMDAIWAAFVPAGRMDDGLFWEDAMPALLREKIALAAQAEAAQQNNPDDQAVAAPSREKKPHLRVVK